MVMKAISFSEFVKKRQNNYALLGIQTTFGRELISLPILIYEKSTENFETISVLFL